MVFLLLRINVVWPENESATVETIVSDMVYGDVGLNYLMEYWPQYPKFFIALSLSSNDALMNAVAFSSTRLFFDFYDEFELPLLPRV